MSDGRWVFEWEVFAGWARMFCRVVLNRTLFFCVSKSTEWASSWSCAEFGVASQLLAVAASSGHGAHELDRMALKIGKKKTFLQKAIHFSKRDGHSHFRVFSSCPSHRKFRVMESQVELGQLSFEIVEELEFAFGALVKIVFETIFDPEIDLLVLGVADFFLVRAVEK